MRKLSSTSDTARVCLEQDRRLSQSLIWKLQRSFFHQQGIEAWKQDTVPHHITSNTFIAGAYSRLVFGFLRDCHAVTGASENNALPLDLSQPVYLIELGSGPGRLAYHFLKTFMSVFPRSAIKDVPFKYVMTDVTEQNLEYWRAHTSLQPFVEQGVLDFALFDAEQSEDIRLWHSGETLSAGTIKNPLVVIANYFFDSIPQDVFYLQDGQLYESLITVSSPREEPDLDDPEILNRVEISYNNRPASTQYYDDPDYNRILQYYRRQLAATYVLFPCAALGCLGRLRALSGGRMLLVSADKGYIGEEALVGRSEPKISVHGSFSMMVNYHAIAQYFLNCGGRALHTSHRHAHISVCAFLLGDHPDGYTETRQAYLEAIEQRGPDDFYTLKKGIEEHYEDLSLQQLTALLRLSGWDSKTFLDAFPALLNHVESAPESLRQELYRAIQHVWDNYYHIGEERDIAFYMAMLLYGMKYYLEALMYFDHSLRLYDPDPSTLYNMAVCHYSLRQLEPAIECVNQTLELDPAFDAAKTMRIKIQSELAGRTS
jgi:tetratricopeptide (TPR) repeat protein